LHAAGELLRRFWVDFMALYLYHPRLVWWTMKLSWRRQALVVLVSVTVWGFGQMSVWAGPPAQRLPSAMLVYPYLNAGGDQDTRIELLNLSGDPQEVNCFFVTTSNNLCNEIGFFVFMTPYQPLGWLASEGLSDPFSGAAAPPFFGTGELKCVVVPPRPELAFHNTIQGRATVFDSSGATVSYDAVGFQRLTDGDFTGVVSLDGVTYAQCPDKLHFQVLADQPNASPPALSDLILVPCSEDFLTQVPTSTSVQFLATNEFEQTFSTSIGITCFDRRHLSTIAGALTRATAASDTLHLSVRGTSVPLIGLVIDAVPFQGSVGTAGNEPSLQGGRSATVVFP
jgi:hypothetical protein